MYLVILIIILKRQLLKGYEEAKKREKFARLARQTFALALEKGSPFTEDLLRLNMLINSGNAEVLSNLKSVVSSNHILRTVFTIHQINMYPLESL